MVATGMLAGRWRLVRWLIVAAIGVVGIAAAFNAEQGRPLVDWRRTAIPAPLPVYEIEAVSGNHHASIANLPLPYVGAPQVPIPVDVNGDLLPDVTASLNLVNAQGLFNNPPNPGQVIAPNIEFLRLATAPLLSQTSPPLKINVKLTLIDLEGQAPDMVIRFGYDTGPGGSIPPKYKALVAGIDTFFQPLQAQIDTTGGYLIGLDPALPDVGLGPVTSAYEGPLTTFATIDQGADFGADVALRYSPQPDRIDITYLADDAGHHITYAHDAQGDVDLTTDALLRTDGGNATFKVRARLDRMPRAITADFLTEDNGGEIHYQSVTNGRLPDVAVDVAQRKPGDRPLDARIDIDGLPRSIDAAWSLPPGGPIATSFDASGQGIGAIEARITNFEGEPTKFTPHVPRQRQHLNVQAGPGGILADETLLSARLERIRHADVAMNPDGGVAASVDIGDGESPLEIHGQLDLRPAGLVALDALTTLSPLPDHIEFSMTPPGENQLTDPTRIVYEASESMDVDAAARIALPGTDPDFSCGEPDTYCADLALRHVPTRVEARLIDLPGDSRVEIDQVQGAGGGGAPLDVFAKVTAGPIAGLIDPLRPLLGSAPVNAELSVQGIPAHIRVRMLEGADGRLERFDFWGCDRNWDTGTCAAGTEAGVADVAFKVNNFDERPANLPHPPRLAPLFLSVVGRGLPDTNDLVHFEAEGHITDINSIQFLTVNDLVGARADIGGNQDFEAYLDVDDYDFDGGDPATGRVDFDADVKISPLPAPLSFCMGGAGRELKSTPTDPITAPCESDDPFGDGTVERSPMTVAYRAASAFDVSASFKVDGDLPFDIPDLPIGFGEFTTIAAQLDIDNVPGEFTANINTPVVPTEGKGENSQVRVLTHAPGAQDLRLELGAQLTTEDADCDATRPDGSAVCLSALVDGLPEDISFLMDTTTGPDPADPGEQVVLDQAVSFHACDFDFFGGTDACRSPLQSIGVVELGARTWAGSPGGVPVYVPPADSPHVVLLADIEGLDDLEIVAKARIEEIRHVSFHQGPDGIDGTIDIGNGVEPLKVYAWADLRDAGALVPDPLRAQVIADLDVTPLPDRIHFEHRKAGADQSVQPMSFLFETSKTVDVRAHVEYRQEDAGDDCGDAGTACATLVINRLPTTLAARMAKIEGVDGDPERGRTLIELDAIPAVGQAKPDIVVDAVVGPEILPAFPNPFDDGPLVGHVELRGFPNFVRVRLDDRQQPNAENPDEPTRLVEQVIARTCILPLTVRCEDGLDAFEARVRNFVRRPLDYPALDPTTNLYAWITGRDNLFEAAVGLTDIREFRYQSSADLVGVRTDIGGDESNLSVHVDIEDYDFDGGDPDRGRVDVRADVLVAPFPTQLDFCFGQNGRPIPAVPLSAVTAPCEAADPFGDGSVDASPLTIAYRAPRPFDLQLDAEITGDLPFSLPDLPIGFGRFTRAAASLTADNIPAAFTAYINTPVVPTTGEEESNQIRVLTDAPGADDLSIVLGAQLTSDDVDCDDPDAGKPGAGAVCAELRIDGVPEHMSVLASTLAGQDSEGSPAILETAVQFHGCNFDFFGTEACIAGTEGEIGVVELDARVLAGNPQPLEPYPSPVGIPSLVALAEVGSLDNLDVVARLRVEDIRSIVFEQNREGLFGHTDIGNGTDPFKVFARVDFRDDFLTIGDAFNAELQADVEITPLPAQMTFSQEILATDDTEYVFHASAVVDIDIRARIIEEGADERCGASGTACATFSLDRLPSHLRARLAGVDGVAGDDGRAQTRFELDAVPAPGQAKPDLFLDAVLGPDLLDVLPSPYDAEPLAVDAAIVGFPNFVRVLMDQRLEPNADDPDSPTRIIEHAHVRTCVLDLFTFCEDGLDEFRFGARNFLDRPADLPAPDPGTPLYVGVTGRGNLFDAAIRFTDLSDFQYHNLVDTTAIRVKAGGGQDFRTLVDIRGFDFDGDEPAFGMIDVAVDLKVTPVPATVDFCLGLPGRDPDETSGNPLMARCEDADPFSEGALDVLPMIVGYQAASPFDVSLDAEITGDLPLPELDLPIGFGEFTKAGVHVLLDNVPGEFTGVVQTPQGPVVRDGLTSNAARVLTHAPGATDMAIEVGAELTTDDADCDEPDPAGDVVCANLLVDGLPEWASILFDTVTNADDETERLQALFQACDYKFYAASPACRAGTAGEISVIDVNARVKVGDTDPLPTYKVPEAGSYAVVLGELDDLDNLDGIAKVHLEGLKGVAFSQDRSGLSAGLELGNGVDPFTVFAQADFREQTVVDLPAFANALLRAEVVITPLPASIEFAQEVHAPGDEEYTFTTSTPIDIDVDAQVRREGADDACGDPGTACMTFALDRLPPSLRARIATVENVGGDPKKAQTRMELDALPAPGQAKPDMFVNAILGPGLLPEEILPSTPLWDDEPLVANAAIIGFPNFVRVFLDEHLEPNAAEPSKPTRKLERMVVRTCILSLFDFCTDGLDEVRAGVRNFLTRPANLPAPDPGTPLYVGLTGRAFLFDTAVRFTDLREFHFFNFDDRVGARVQAGGGQDFRAVVDIREIDLDGDDNTTGVIAVAADARISPIPATIDFCFAPNGREASAPSGNPVLAPCENTDPFGEGPLDALPMTIAYRAATPFDVSLDYSLQGDLQIPIPPDLPLRFGDIARIAASLSVENIPGQLTAFISTPLEPEVNGANESSATRVLTHAPGASDMRIELGAEIATAGASCDQPQPLGDVVCASVLVDGLPDWVSVLADTTTTDDGETLVQQGAQFHACDYKFYAASPACRAGTQGSIGVIEVGARVKVGSPGALPTFEAPTDVPHLTALAVVDSFSALDASVKARIEDLRAVTIRQTPSDTDASVDLGNGTDPLLVHAYADLRQAAGLGFDVPAAEIKADVSITPLPAQMGIHMHTPGLNNPTDPMEIRFDSSAMVDVVADAEYREAGAGPACGDQKTICAHAEILDIPQHVVARILDTKSAIVGNTRNTDTQITMQFDRDNASDPKPSVHVSATMGLPDTVPIVGGKPLVADFRMTGVPEHISVRMESIETLETQGLNLVQTHSDMERLQFFTCQRNFATEACAPGTTDSIGVIDLSARTFRLRPTGFPAPPAVTAPLFVGVTGRGSDVEALVRLQQISEVQFLNRDGVTGARASLGGTTPTVSNNLSVRVDVADFSLGDRLHLGDLDIDDPLVDVVAAVDIIPFPGELSFCMRKGGEAPIPAATGIAFTAACEQANPFGASPAPGHAPMSIGFDANTTFDISADVDAVLTGNKHGTATPVPQQRLTASVDIGDVPDKLEVHLLQPRQTEVATPTGLQVQQAGPFRALVNAPASSGLDLDFSAAYLVGNQTTCKDPRQSVEATCVSGRIVDLPTRIDLFLDPDLDLRDPSVDLNDPNDIQNFKLTTSGTGPTDFQGFEFSSVAPSREAVTLPGPLGSLAMDVLIAHLDLGDLPNPLTVVGTLDLPDNPSDPPTASFDVVDPNPNDSFIPSLPTISAQVQNFIAPDPTANVVIPTRPVGVNALTTYPITLIQRGDAFKVSASIAGVRGFGIRDVRDTNRDPIGTKAIRVDFATDFNIHAFVDLQPDAANRVIADVLLEDIPAGMDICIRGPREGTQIGKTALNGTWCDASEVAAAQGALEFATRPHTTGRKLDVDAFARLLFGGGSSVLAARVNIDEIPQVLRVKLPADQSKDIELNAFSRSGSSLVADGIGSIQFEAATFDLATADTGFTGTLPYTPITNNTAPMPAKAAPSGAQAGLEYLHAAANEAENDFHARGRIGRTDGQPSSQLQSFLYSNKACTAPSPAPPDYPFFPVNDGVSSYKCVKVKFEAGTDGTNPLLLDVNALLADGTALKLHDAGLSDIPNWVQLTLAETELFSDPANGRGWRRPCGPASGTGAEPAGTIDCMPPKVRFDQPSNSVLFGVAEFGRPADLPTLSSTPAKRQAPNFDAVPTAGDWDSAWDTTDPDGTTSTLDDVPGDAGIRAKVLIFDNHTPLVFTDDRMAVKAGIRLAIPQSLTIDQIQKYKLDKRTQTSRGEFNGGTKADDLRLRISIRDSLGQVVNSLGEVAAMIHLVDSDAQALLTRACNTPINNSNAIDRPSTCSNYTRGMSIPGEMGISIFMRDSLTDLPDSKMRKSSLIQIDGRLSATLSAGLRLVTPGLELSKGISLSEAEASIKNVPAMNATQLADRTQPSFRLRAEIIEDGKKPDGSPPPGCSVFCFNTALNVHVRKAFAGFDFAPTGTVARRVDAVIHLDGAKIGLDVAGWTTVSTSGQAAAPISAAVAAKVDPLNIDIKSVIDLPQVSTRSFIEGTLGLPGWLSDAIDWLIGKVFDVLEAILNSFPIQLRLDSRLLFQLEIDRLSRFTFRNNLLHAFTSATGPGKATIGPINLDMDTFHGGLAFDRTFDIPDWIDWIPGVPDEVRINILLLGYGYNPGFNTFLTPLLDAALGPNILITFRRCSVLDQILGTAADVNKFQINGGASENYVIWPGSDPRLTVGGILLDLLALFTGNVLWALVPRALDVLIDYLAGPIFCNAFNVDAANYQAINTGAGDANSYNPGNGAANDTAFPGHKVPGQFGQPDFLPLDPPDTSTSGGVTIPLPTPSPGAAAPPDPPPAPAVLYSGPTTTIATGNTFNLCGVHTFSTLTVNGTINVSPTAVSGNPLGTGTACPAGSEGTLELRANTLLVNSGGAILGDNATSDVPHFDAFEASPTYPQYRATGNSGGTHAGVGHVGSFPNSGVRPYEVSTIDTTILPGAPGSQIPAGTTTPQVTGAITSAGAPGKGGGGIVLRADASLAIRGTVSANGGAGAENAGGTADNDPDDNNIAGTQQHVCDPDNDPKTDNSINVDNARLDGAPGSHGSGNCAVTDPGGPYEHTGFAGAGGGSGGGVVLEARRTVDIVGGTVRARGGNGGGGHLGAGGGGAGGIIKVLAPVQTGVTQSALAAQVVSGLNGSASVSLFVGVPAPSLPIEDDGVAPDGATQDTNGSVLLHQPPYAVLQPFGPFWRATGPGVSNAAFDAYIVGAGGATDVTVVTCAVRLPYSDGPPDANSLSSLLNSKLPTIQYKDAMNTPVVPPLVVGTFPSVGTPCGSRSGSTIVELDRTHTFNGYVEPPSASSKIELNPSISGYYGIYTTAFRPQTSGNNCLVAAGGPNDATDCFVEGLAGIEWIIGVDADRPVVSITAPAAGAAFTTTAVTLNLSVTETANLSGLDFVECKVTGQNDFQLCPDGTVLQLQGGDGSNTITVRAYDEAGNVSTTVTRTVTLDQAAPNASAALSPAVPNGSNGWYKTAPSITISNYSGTLGPAARPYAYKFDNGLETLCPEDLTSPYVCTISASDVGGLVPGGHIFKFTAINSAGTRFVDDNDATTPSPMPRISPLAEFDFKFDPTPPQVVLATVPAAADKTHNSLPYYSVQPFLAFSAIDQVGASGVATIEYSLNGGASFTTYDPASPPQAPNGTTTVCFRATDNAGNTFTAPCQIIRVDGAAPTFTLAATGGTSGNAGWYRSAPSFSLTSYADNTGGVSTDAGHFRYRVDNGGFSDCNTGCFISSTLVSAIGEHRVSASAADRFGNRSAEQSIDLKVDSAAPVTRALLSPPHPTVSGWYDMRPWVTLWAVDQAAGSGVSTVSYTVDGGAPQVYGGPFRASSSTRVLCAWATDVAGNIEGSHCVDFATDPDAPTATLLVNNLPTVDPGPDGWFDVAPTVVLTNFADGIGSGPATGGAFRRSVDNGQFQFCAAGICDLSSFFAVSGDHTLDWAAVDQVRHRTPAHARIKVDLAAPSSQVQLSPAVPNGPAGFYETRPWMVLAASDDAPGVKGSGVARIEYRLAASGAFTTYTGPVRLPVGQYPICHRGVDVAGHVEPDRCTTSVVKIDDEAPTANLLVNGVYPPDPGPDGWYNVPPTVTLSGYSDAALSGGVSSGAPASGPFRRSLSYTQFKSCLTDPCDLSTLFFGTDSHVLDWAAVDLAGNRGPGSATIRVDTEAPRSALQLGPNQPDGLSGWYESRPYLQVPAVDQHTGSGVARVDVRLGATGPFTTYTGPILLPVGSYVICHRAVDVAGNVEPTTCTDGAVKVDDTAPAASLQVIPSTPNGQAGWYVTAPTVLLVGYNDGAGSGPPSTGGYRYQLDEDGFAGCATPTCVLSSHFTATGSRLLEWAAVDVAGNRHSDAARINVDLEPPATQVVLSPGAPEGSNGWFLKRPWVNLLAADPGPPPGSPAGGGSGVAEVQYSLDGAAYSTYTASFQLTAGAHSLCVRATDVAGNVETPKCQTVKADDADPTATLVGPTPDVWLTSGFTMTVTRADTVPGSGFAPSDSDLSDLCDHRPPVDPAPAGTCVSVDGGPFVPYLGAVTIGEGVHRVRAYSVDLAGRRSAIVAATYKVDLSAPTPEIRSLPSAPAVNGWWRTSPRFLLRAVDGDQSSGVVALEYRLDSGPWTAYVTPFSVPEGVHTVHYRATDAVGRVTTRSLSVPVDVTVPLVKATLPNPLVWSRGLLGPKTAKLQYELTENLSGPVHVRVVIFDAAMNPVRVIDQPGVPITPGVKLSGFVTWDGRNETLTGLVPLGLYYYRVVAIDAAGNIAMSGESRPVQIKAGL